MTERKKLLAEVESFLKKSGMASTRFGIEAAGDRAFMIRLRSGAGIGIDKAGRVRKYMAKWRPEKKPSRRAALQPAV